MTIKTSLDIMNMFFISLEKFSSFLRYLDFCSEFFGHAGKR